MPVQEKRGGGLFSPPPPSCFTHEKDLVSTVQAVASNYTNYTILTTLEVFQAVSELLTARA